MSAPNLAALLRRWEEAYWQKRDLSAAELCSQTPELLDELQQAIDQRRAALPLLTTPPASKEEGFANAGMFGETLPVAAGTASNGFNAPSGYELLGELGRGGMGVVYRARHRQLNREVALKMIRDGGLADESERQRFLAEAEAIAAVQHPGIVQVFDYGTHGELPYFVLELCPGGTLADRLNGTPLEAKAAARLMEQVARAVQAAHDKGIVHRDLKPGNVLLASPERACEDSLVPKVTDFGLAKKVEGGSGLTVTGAVMGTPSYMAPEQAQGRKDVGPLADVYALGAVLYECLTGRPPFKAANVMETLGQVINQDPAPLREVNAGIHRDLETICLKCLQKELGRRYASATELADDLGRFQRSEPVLARPVGTCERLGKWVRRNKAVASFLMATGMLLLTIVVVSWILTGWALGEKRRANEKEEQAQQQKQRADDRAEDARQQKHRADDNARKSAENEQKALEQKRQADEQRDRAQRLVYASKLALAEDAWNNNDARVALQHLDECQWNLRGWEHDQLWTLFHGNQVTLRGSTVAVNSVAWSADGKCIVSGSVDGTVRVWDAETGQEVHSLKGHTDRVISVAWRGDGKRIVSGGGAFQQPGEVKVWDADTGRQVRSLVGHTATVNSVAWSQDGKHIVSGSADSTVRIWDAETGRQVRSLEGHTRDVTSVAMSPDGKRIVSGSWDKTVRVWDAQTGKDIRSLEASSGPVRTVAWSPDGKRIAAGAGSPFASWKPGEVNVWDAVTGQEVRALETHTARGDSVAWSPEGNRIVTGSVDGTLRVWHSETGWQVRTLKGHTGPVRSVAWCPEGNRIVSGSEDGTVRVWHAGTDQEVRVLEGHTGSVRNVAWSPDGNHIVSASVDGKIRVWHAVTGHEIHFFAGHKGFVNSVAWTRDSKRIFSGGGAFRQPGELKVWDADTGQQVRSLVGHTDRITSVAMRPDGKCIVSGSEDKSIRVCDADTGKVILFLEGHKGVVNSVAWRGDGKRIVSGGGAFQQPGEVKVWDADTGRQVRSLVGHTATVNCVAWSQDGKRIISGSADSTVRVWDAETGRQVRSLEGHKQIVTSVAVSPDGKRFVSASGDKTVKVWDAETGQEVRSLKGHTQMVASVAWSLDGKRIVSGGYDRTVRVWEADRGQEVRFLKGHTQKVTSVAWSEERKRIVARDVTGQVLCWSGESGQLLPDAHSQMPLGPPRTTLPDGRFLRIHGHNITLADPRRLKSEDELNRQRLAKWANFDPAQHRVRLQEAEDGNNAFAAVFHLRRLLRATPHDSSLHIHLAHVEASQNHLAQAITHLMHALFLHPRIALWPSDPGAAQRGHQAALSRNWPVAVTAFQRAIQQPGATVGLRGDLLLAQTAAMQKQQASQSAADIAQLLPSLEHPAQRTSLFDYALAIPCDDATVQRLLEQTTVALAQQKNAVNLHCQGAALYRAGKLEEADKMLSASVMAQGTGGYVETWLFQALVARDLGRLEDAARRLARAEAWHAKQTFPTWQQRVLRDALLGEARTPPRMRRGEQ